MGMGGQERMQMEMHIEMGVAVVTPAPRRAVVTPAPRWAVTQNRRDNLALRRRIRPSNPVEDIEARDCPKAGGPGQWSEAMCWL